MAFVSLAYGEDQKEVKKIVPFRCGNIYSAETSSARPDIPELDIKKARVTSPCWCELIVKLDAGRTLSVYDFSLERDGASYPCFAIAERTAPYSGSLWILRDTEKEKFYRLLFPVPAPDGEYKILFNLYPTKIPAVSFKVKPSDGGVFLSADKVPYFGCMILPEPPPPPLKKAEPEGKAAPEVNDAEKATSAPGKK